MEGVPQFALFHSRNGEDQMSSKVFVGGKEGASVYQVFSFSIILDHTPLFRRPSYEKL